MELIKANQIDTGTKPGQIVALDAEGKLPAIDGSQLTNLPLSRDLESYKEEMIERLVNSEAEIRERVALEAKVVEPVVVEAPAPVEEEPVEEEPVVEGFEEVQFETFVAPELTLEEAIDEAVFTINALAENTRQVYLGVGPAQMMVYAEKFEEASDYLVDNMPNNVSRYPFIKAEVEATGHSAESIANSIIDKKGEWIAFNAKVERIRMIAKTQFMKAQTLEHVDKVIKLASDHLDKLID